MAFLPSLSVLTSVFNGERFLPDFFRNLWEQTLFPELEIILVLNEPTAAEKQMVIDFQQRAPNQVEIIYAKKRETLGASWNRAWKISRARYLAFWNVDDRRIVDSLQRQMNALEAHPDWNLCYGDYLAVSAYGSETGKRRYAPEYRASNFRRSFAQGGAFWFLRKDVSNAINYFDEQFFVASDMEFSFRMAVKGLDMGKCEGLLGYFTDTGTGLSTRGGARLSEIERTVIQLRYGVFDKVDRRLLNVTDAYRLTSIKVDNSWIDLESILPNLSKELQWKRPLWILGYLRGWSRAALRRIGLLDDLHAAQDKYLKREI